MSISINNFDSLEKLIFDEGLRINSIDFHKEIDLMIIVLNTQAVLQQKISISPALKNASQDSLTKYELIANGIGVHWPELNEDLSLKGILQAQLRAIIKKESLVA